MIFIIGGEGFVGSAYVRLLAGKGLPHQVINRANYDAFAGQACDVLINANGNSKKFMADRDPKWEFDASVRSVAHALEDFKAGYVIHLSTGDVYPDQSSPEVSREEQAIDPARQSRYGAHKYIAETLVRAAAPKHLIMRMGGFVGPGMKKNAIYDMLTGAPVWLQPESQLQFIGTDTAAKLVWGLYESGVRNEVVNLGASGAVRIGDIHARLGSASAFQPEARLVQFEISTQKLAHLAGPLPTSAGEVAAFLDGAAVSPTKP